VRQPGVWPQSEANPSATPLGSRNGLGTTSLVLGLLALISSWLTIGLVVGIAAVVTGLLARARVARGEATNRGMAIAGIALGVVAILASVLVLVVVIWWALTPVHDCTAMRGSPRC
jgi:Domain of unknown function (DUF4190)